MLVLVPQLGFRLSFCLPLVCGVHCAPARLNLDRPSVQTLHSPLVRGSALRSEFLAVGIAPALRAGHLTASNAIAGQRTTASRRSEQPSATAAAAANGSVGQVGHGDRREGRLKLFQAPVLPLWLPSVEPRNEGCVPNLDRDRAAVGNRRQAGLKILELPEHRVAFPGVEKLPGFTAHERPYRADGGAGPDPALSIQDA